MCGTDVSASSLNRTVRKPVGLGSQFLVSPNFSSSVDISIVLHLVVIPVR